MADLDVISKLSRILETHSFGDDHSTSDFEASSLNHFLNRATTTTSTPNKARNAIQSPPRDGSPVRTSFDSWQNKQVSKPPMILTESQRGNLVEQLFRTKNDIAIIKDQNAGLRSQLTGYEFKPKINKHSLELAKSLKPMIDRTPGILAERQNLMNKKKVAAAEAEVKDCTFSPKRQSAVTSDKLLKKLGRDKKVTPEDFFEYKRLKDSRNDMRKRILDEIQAGELTFTPEIHISSKDFNEKLLKKQSRYTLTIKKLDCFATLTRLFLPQ